MAVKGQEDRRVLPLACTNQAAGSRFLNLRRPPTFDVAEAETCVPAPRHEPNSVCDVRRQAGQRQIWCPIQLLATHVVS